MSKDIDQLYEELKSEEDNIKPIESGFTLARVVAHALIAIADRLDKIATTLDAIELEGYRNCNHN
jgi:hypothetical protein